MDLEEPVTTTTPGPTPGTGSWDGLVAMFGFTLWLMLVAVAPVLVIATWRALW